MKMGRKRTKEPDGSRCRVTITVPWRVRLEMDAHPEINWSAEAAMAFEKRMLVSDAPKAVDGGGPLGDCRP